MAELDFSKIFGETATSKASFTDENYLTGWEYLGSTPPPYQLFDYLQSQNDKKSKYLYDKTIENDNKLALHNTNATAHADIRGKITSDINSHNINTSAHADIRTKITSDINSHNSDTSAHADIRTKITSDINSHNINTSAHATILNAIKAISGMGAYDIAPSKTIDAIIPLLGFGGIVAQNLKDNGYIKFANGLTLQFGLTDDIPKNGTYRVNYPIAFTLLLYAGGFATINGDASNLDEIKMYNLPNQYNMTLLNTADNYTARTYWLAIGLI